MLFYFEEKTSEEPPNQRRSHSSN